MGEAKRRKAAGTYPDPTSPLEAVRRFWCGRAPGSAADFVAPTGTVAITFDVDGADPSTCLMDAASLMPVLDFVSSLAGSLSYYPLVRFIAAEFRKAKKDTSASFPEWIGPAGLWAALHHPQSGKTLRETLSEKLRETGKAHLTWHLGPKGLAIAVGDGFFDLEAASAMAPRDSVTTIGGKGPKAPLN